MAGVVDLAGCRGLRAAAGPLAVLVAEPDRVADGGRDGLAVADVQGQAGAAGAQAELAAQEAGEAAGAGQQLDRLADDRLHQRLPRQGRTRAPRRSPPGIRVSVRGRVTVPAGVVLARVLLD